MYYIGIDLGGTTIKAGLVNEAYEITHELSIPTQNQRQAEEIIKDMAGLCKDLMAAAHINETEVHSVGIGCPGLVEVQSGKVLSSSNLNFENVPVREIFKKYMDFEVYIENDANCAALGEVMAGVAKGAQSALMITFGTGVGGGIVLDGKIYRGAFCGAGEIGHQVINFHETESCGCGRKGCYEQYASATALVRYAKEAAKENPQSLMLEYAENKAIENINGKVIFEAAHNGDAVALEVLDGYYKLIAHGAANLINILEPEMLVLGGGISGQGEYIVAPITKYISQQMYGGLNLKTQIKAATLGNGAGIIGAALLGKSNA
nr:ROK family protein [uncultured Cellulosilyticum sp.]